MTNVPAKPLVVGFIAVRQTRTGGIRGGYLLTTENGRPLEFHYTNELAISPSIRALYGACFESAIYGETIGHALTNRQTTAPRIILAEHHGFFALRRLIPAPIVRIVRVEAAISEPSSAATDPSWRAEADANFPQDVASFEKLRERVAPAFDWLEPFDRLTAALGELDASTVDRPAA